MHQFRKTVPALSEICDGMLFISFSRVFLDVVGDPMEYFFGILAKRQRPLTRAAPAVSSRCAAGTAVMPAEKKDMEEMKANR